MRCTVVFLVLVVVIAFSEARLLRNNRFAEKRGTALNNRKLFLNKGLRSPGDEVGPIPIETGQGVEIEANTEEGEMDLCPAIKELAKQFQCGPPENAESAAGELDSVESMGENPTPAETPEEGNPDKKRTSYIKSLLRLLESDKRKK